MCAWKRGTQNNLPGVIRMGQIREFLAKTSRDDSVQTSLNIIDFNNDQKVPDHLNSLYKDLPVALICTQAHGLSQDVCKYLDRNPLEAGMIYLHSHKYPHSILSCVMHDDVPNNSIILKDYHLVNSKVCVGDFEEFSLYLGEPYTYDTREGALGDTKVRYKELTSIRSILISLQTKSSKISEHRKQIDGKLVSQQIAKAFYGCILTKEEVFVFEIAGDNYICNIDDIIVDDGEISNEEDDYIIPESYRGIVDASTDVFIKSNCPMIDLVNNSDYSTSKDIKNLVYVITNDYEVFPVKRRLLRPCIALTSIVQYGRGKYAYDQSSSSAGIVAALDPAAYQEKLLSLSEKEDNKESIDEEYLNEDLIKVAVDACTFDRVLLYLEHEARQEEFKFDPLIVNELYNAAKVLNISGLKEACQKVIGSFQDRVRRTPIRLDEVISRNKEGRIIQGSDQKKRKDTLLIMSGMVFDITHWLDEHPGGSTIIPEQALNVDSTVFFEIYHASKQSFLYLKEFYIGELAHEDLERVALPANCPVGVQASDAFMEQLRRLTGPWRLKTSDIQSYNTVHKSF